MKRRGFIAGALALAGVATLPAVAVAEVTPLTGSYIVNGIVLKPDVSASLAAQEAWLIKTAKYVIERGTYTTGRVSQDLMNIIFREVINCSETIRNNGGRLTGAGYIGKDGSRVIVFARRDAEPELMNIGYGQEETRKRWYKTYHQREKGYSLELKTSDDKIAMMSPTPKLA